VTRKEAKKALFSLRTAIKAAGQRKVARESGIARRTLSRFMQGKSVRKEILEKLIGVLRARPD
jgi:transcriptional regulator with XRE-family HTH domain